MRCPWRCSRVGIEITVAGPRAMLGVATSLHLSQPARVAIAALCAGAAWALDARDELRAPAPTWLRCPALGARRLLDDSHRLPREGPAPADALPGNATLAGRVYLPEHCVDGWLTPAAAPLPDQVAAPRVGHTAVAATLAGVRPGDRIDVDIGGFVVGRGLAVLTVDGAATDDDGEGGTRTWATPVPVRVEVPDAAVASLAACLTLGATTARTAPADATPWVAPSCAGLGTPGPGHVAFVVTAGGVQPQTRVDLVGRGGVIVEGARVLDVDGRVLPGGDEAARTGSVRVEVPPEAVVALDSCGPVSVRSSAAETPRLVEASGCTSRRIAPPQPEVF